MRDRRQRDPFDVLSLAAGIGFERTKETTYFRTVKFIVYASFKKKPPETLKAPGADHALIMR